MFRLFLLFAIAASGAVIPRATVDSCDSGSLQCCNSVETSSSDSSGTLHSGLVPINLQGLTGQIGLDCKSAVKYAAIFKNHTHTYNRQSD